LDVILQDKSMESLSHLVNLLNKDMEPSTQAQVLREVLTLCQSNANLVNGSLIERLRMLCSNSCHVPLLDKLSGVG
jgi:hypothetical protein